ncbi:molybdenum cofactor biosynthesis protein MoaE [Campylobacter sp. 19-13652]|uniref:molybdopterin synthase catalytic subunit n=1 Tax=Campylobacter sp. 19-13652 TaxID=2840180 RepID=UPI001C76DFFB|nr:molybdenum cofactor biosynthesis protein MoaE [Campylobacter sp. 19-13652]BCX79997.1 molybdenum cofactor biosynthesis protein MoaE [Campylobacter sp. 19-13652]
MQIYSGSLNVDEILSSWYAKSCDGKSGALVSFVGIVRDEGGISGLSFEIYKPLLKAWFKGWQERARTRGAEVFFAHSTGDVLIGQSSYVAAVKSPKRRVALEMIDEFVEDFKASAPIWKYDIINGEKIYAATRSSALRSAGLLAKDDA